MEQGLSYQLLAPERATPVSPFEFVNKWHSKTIADKKVLRNSDGRPTTVNAVGVQVGDKVYTVPGYIPDAEGGPKLFKQGTPNWEDRAAAYWVDKIPNLVKEGKLVGIPAKWNGPIETHPANVGAKRNHEFMNKASKTIPENAYKYTVKDLVE